MKSNIKQRTYDLYQEGRVNFRDDRELINGKIAQFPYNCLSFIVSRDTQNDQTNFGTIFMISKWYGLTAAHNIVRINRKFQVSTFDEMDTFPGANGEINIGSRAPGQNSTVVKISLFRVSSKFYTSCESDQISGSDFALVMFQKPMVNTQYCKITKVNEKDLLNMLNKKVKVEVIGYPCEKMSAGQGGRDVVMAYEGSGPLQTVSQKWSILEYNVNTSQGQSGSPIIYNPTKHPFVIGIHNSYNLNQKCNRGVLFTRSVLNEIYGWIEELQTPLFRVSSFRNASSELTMTSQEYVSFKNSKLSNSTHGSSILKECKKQESFMFKWDYEFKRRNLFLDRGNGVLAAKQNLEKYQSILCSFEPFPSNKVSSCSICIRQNQGSIHFGLLTAEGKKRTYQNDSSSSLFAFYNLLSFSVVNKGQKYREETMMKNKEEVFKKSNNQFEEGKYKVTILVDTIKNKVEIHRNQDLLVLSDLPKNEKVYLSLGLTSKDDEIEVLR